MILFACQADDLFQKGDLQQAAEAKRLYQEGCALFEQALVVADDRMRAAGTEQVCHEERQRVCNQYLLGVCKSP